MRCSWLHFSRGPRSSADRHLRRPPVRAGPGGQPRRAECKLQSPPSWRPWMPSTTRRRPGRTPREGPAGEITAILMRRGAGNRAPQLKTQRSRGESSPIRLEGDRRGDPVPAYPRPTAPSLGLAREVAASRSTSGLRPKSRPPLPPLQPPPTPPHPFAPASGALTPRGASLCPREPRDALLK